MEFSKKKLPIDLLNKLYRVRVETVQSFALMLAPVYVYLKANEKLVSVKAPLDFFTPQELKRMEVYTYFYFSAFVTSVLPYRQAGQAVRQLLSFKPESAPPIATEPYPEVVLPAAPFETAEAVLTAIGPLWTRYSRKGLGMEPYLATVFVNELCDLIPGDLLVPARERDVEKFDRAIIRSSWVVFMALHLGYCDLPFLNNLRLRVFQEIVYGTTRLFPETEVDELIGWSYSLLQGSDIQFVKVDFLNTQLDRIGQKLGARLDKINRKHLRKKRFAATIFGDRGFIDV